MALIPASNASQSATVFRASCCRSAVVHRHAPAAGRQRQRDFAAEPARRAGDEHGARAAGRFRRGGGGRHSGTIRGDDRTHKFNDRPAQTAGAGHFHGRRLDRLRPLHGAGAVRAGPGLLRQRARQVRHHARGRKGEGSDFVTAPELTPLFGQALAAQVGEALVADRHRRGLGVRRRLRRAGAATARHPGRPGAPLHHRRPVRHAARAPAGAAGSARRQGALGRRAARGDPGRGGRQRGARRHAGQAAGAPGRARRRRLARARRHAGRTTRWPGPTAPPNCARRWTCPARTTT